MKTRDGAMVRWTYILGIALLIAAAVVYTESWWHLFERFQQAGVTAGFLFLFFLLAYFCRKNYPFITRLSFFAGFVCLGPAIALVGTIYHSQAESWWLFFFWLLPVLVVTLQVKIRPLLVLRFLLVQALLWSIIFPEYYSWPDTVTLIALLTASGINACIYWGSIKKGQDILLPHAWFAAIHFYPFYGAFRYVLPDVEVLAGTAYLAVLAVSFYMMRHKPAALKITIVFAGFYVFQFLFITMIDIYSEFVFILIFLFAAGAVYASVKLITSFSKRGRGMQSKLFLLHTVTLVGALTAAGAYSGFFGLIVWGELSSILFITIVFMFGLVLLRKELDVFLSQSIVFFSMIQLVVFSFDAAVWQMIPLIVATGFIWMRGGNSFYRIVVYTLANTAFVTWLYVLFESMETVIWTTALLNISLAAVGYRLLSNRILYLSGYLFAVLLLFQLPYTVTNTEPLYWSYLAGYFLLLTGLLYLQVRQKDRSALTITAVLWFIFLFTQYMDLLWEHVHLAFTLFLLGTGFLLTAYTLEKKKQLHIQEAPLHPGKIGVAAVLLTIIILVVPAVQKEVALSSGETIWLEVDDYGAGYEDIDNEAYISIYDGTYEEEFTEGTYVYAQLEETEDGSYRVINITAAKEEAGSPSIRGRVNTWNGAEFGIDSYPAPGGEISHVLLRMSLDAVAVIEDVRYLR